MPGQDLAARSFQFDNARFSMQLGITWLCTSLKSPGWGNFMRSGNRHSLSQKSIIQKFETGSRPRGLSTQRLLADRVFFRAVRSASPARGPILYTAIRASVRTPNWRVPTQPPIWPTGAYAPTAETPPHSMGRTPPHRISGDHTSPSRPSIRRAAASPAVRRPKRAHRARHSPESRSAYRWDIGCRICGWLKTCGNAGCLLKERHVPEIIPPVREENRWITRRGANFDNLHSDQPLSPFDALLPVSYTQD